MSRFLIKNHVMVTESHLLLHTKILVKRVREELYVPKIPVITIFLLLHKYRMNRGLVLFF